MEAAVQQIQIELLANVKMADDLAQDLWGQVAELVALQSQPKRVQMRRDVPVLNTVFPLLEAIAQSVSIINVLSARMGPHLGKQCLALIHAGIFSRLRLARVLDNLMELRCEIRQ